MIEYVVSANPDERIMRRAATILEGGGLVVVPTDTSWSIVCSIASRDGVARLRKMGERRDRPPTVMCDSISSVSDLCEVDGAAFRLIKRLTPGPYVFVLRSTNRVAKEFNLRRAEIGVRIPDHSVPLGLIGALEKPLLSATAKRTMIDPDQGEPDFPEELLFSGGWELEDLPGVDLILDPGEDNERRLATVLDLRSGEVSVLRHGAGPYPA
ncbi:MAG: threonylcarbamoyl-AMP synthase [Spirochaetales bacterium]|nr:MAG: threonylcarbamoyl-AMP synthase [Spirochaetales bacterium]